MLEVSGSKPSGITNCRRDDEDDGEDYEPGQGKGGLSHKKDKKSCKGEVKCHKGQDEDEHKGKHEKKHGKKHGDKSKKKPSVHKEFTFIEDIYEEMMGKQKHGQKFEDYSPSPKKGKKNTHKKSCDSSKKNKKDDDYEDNSWGKKKKGCSKNKDYEKENSGTCKNCDVSFDEEELDGINHYTDNGYNKGYGSYEEDQGEDGSLNDGEQGDNEDYPGDASTDDYGDNGDMQSDPNEVWSDPDDTSYEMPDESMIDETEVNAWDTEDSTGSYDYEEPEQNYNKPKRKCKKSPDATLGAPEKEKDKKKVKGTDENGDDIIIDEDVEVNSGGEIYNINGDGNK